MPRRHSTPKQGWLELSPLLVLIPCCLPAQTLLLDRSISPESNARIIGIDSRADFSSLMGDDFTIGRDGETWVIDRIRVWVMSKNTASMALGAFFQGITFLGGLANDQDTVECACHDLIPLKTGTLSERGSTNADIMISPGGISNRWQVDFQNFHWSVPGGAKIQFAIKASPRSSQNNSPPRLLVAAAPVRGEHSLRIFTAEGAFKSFLNKKAQDSTNSLAFSIQVWGHPSPASAP